LDGMAETSWLPALVAIQPLHGPTSALLHLTCMRLLAQCVPGRLAATALTVYGTVGIGAPTALLILAAGQLGAHFGVRGVWVMAVLCAVAHSPCTNAARAHRRNQLILPTWL
jgi:MFS transporter, PPP family, 3-phenylpropionic acid transporter